MKQFHFLTAFLFLTSINLNAQTVTITGSCAVDGDYAFSTDVNGRPSYVTEFFIIQWTGTRWEHNLIGDPDVGMYNDANTATPPASSFSPWIADLCDPAGVFTGDGTSEEVIVSINEYGGSNINIKIYPNPASDYITISGIKKRTENYEVYNLIGQKMREGIISNEERIDIQNLSKGIYLLKFEGENTLIFIRE